MSDKETAEQIIVAMVDLGPKGHEILVEALGKAWKRSTEKLLDESPPPGDDDTEQVITGMLQVSMAMEIASSLSAVFTALSKYNLTQKVLEEIASDGYCDHPECNKLREARDNADNN